MLRKSSTPPPLSQQLPRLDKLLHRPRRGKVTRRNPALAIRSLVKLPYSVHTQQGQVVCDLPQFLARPDFLFAEIGAPRHNRISLPSFVFCSPWTKDGKPGLTKQA